MGWIAIAVLVTALVGTLDYATGSELSFALFYLTAVGLAAWKVGRRAGLMLALFCAGTWFAADRAGGHLYTQPFVQYWNTGIRFGFFVVVALLVAALREALDREQAVARVDTVTEAANRRQLLESLEEELERCRRYGRPVTLAYVDLDHFKKVNDHLGHAVGDQVLRVVARTLTERLRKTDTVARFGGDEFAILLPETDAEAARFAIDAARAELLERMGDFGWPVTFSVGVVTSPDGRGDVESIIRQADELMYEVKREGKNRVVYAEMLSKPEPPVRSRPKRSPD